MYENLWYLYLVFVSVLQVCAEISKSSMENDIISIVPILLYSVHLFMRWRSLSHQSTLAMSILLTASNQLKFLQRRRRRQRMLKRLRRRRPLYWVWPRPEESFFEINFYNRDIETSIEIFSLHRFDFGSNLKFLKGT